MRKQNYARIIKTDAERTCLEKPHQQFGFGRHRSSFMRGGSDVSNFVKDRQNIVSVTFRCAAFDREKQNLFDYRHQTIRLAIEICSPPLFSFGDKRSWEIFSCKHKRREIEKKMSPLSGFKSSFMFGVKTSHDTKHLRVKNQTDSRRFAATRELVCLKRNVL